MKKPTFFSTKQILFLAAIVISISAKAQLLSLGGLDGSRWMHIVRLSEESPADTVRIAFDKQQRRDTHRLRAEHPTRGKIDTVLTIVHDYYMADEIPATFDRTQIGRHKQGRYIVVHNATAHAKAASKAEKKGTTALDFEVWELTRATPTELELTFRHTNALNVIGGHRHGDKIVYLREE